MSVATLAPFRGARAGLRMGLRPIDGDGFSRDAARVAAKRRLLGAHPEALAAMPGSETACAELAALIGAADFAGAARMVADDLCLLLPEGGSYVLRAGALAFPTDWRLADKLGKPLRDIHSPIHGYAEKLADGVEHFFRTLAPGPVFERANWFVVEEDALRHLPEGSGAARFAHVTAANAGDTLFVRCERQTLRKLPASGAALFTIDVHVEPLGSLPPDLARDLASAVASLPDGERERRGAPFYAAALSGYAAGLCN